MRPLPDSAVREDRVAAGRRRVDGRDAEARVERLPVVRVLARARVLVVLPVAETPTTPGISTGITTQALVMSRCSALFGG